MTAIAYKDFIVAADSLSTSGNYVHNDRIKKIKKLKMNLDPDDSVWPIEEERTVIFTGTGNNNRIQAGERWWMNGCQRDKWPFKDEKDYTTSIIIFTENRHYEFYNNKGPYPTITEYEDTDHDAWGSGWIAAETAMYMGCNAVKAIKVANDRLINCGGRILKANVKSKKIEWVK